MTSLTQWVAASATSKKIAVISDSIGENDATYNLTAFPWHVRERLARRWGASSSFGMLGCWHDVWTFAGTWTQATTSDAWDVGVYYNAGVTPFSGVNLGNAAADIATYTKLGGDHNILWVGEAITGFKLYVVDGASSANFSYSVDGGAWTDVTGVTWGQDNGIEVITIGTAVTSTVEVRGANAAGTAANVYLMGIEPTTAGTGPVLHWLSSGGQDSRQVVRTTSGDWTAWLDLVQPQVVVWLLVNDLLDVIWDTGAGNGADYQTRLEAVADVVSGYGGSMVLVNYFGHNHSGMDGVTGSPPSPASSGANSQQMATINAAVATSYGFEAIDLYDLVGNFTTTNAAGYLAVDELHPSDPGGEVITQWVWPSLTFGTGQAFAR